MELVLKDCGLKVKNMELEYRLILTGLVLKETLCIIYGMAKELRPTLTEPNT
jgi:hypothetical protein